ncbi:MAG: hypothetical protein ACYC5G_01065 [Candidatus Doudnabacteria bacterium]
MKAIKKQSGMLESFTTFPRKILSDYRNEELQRNELILLFWLRSNGNPYGIFATSATAIQEDLFPNVGKNYVQQLLRSLRTKKYIYYEAHQGKTGSFEVHLNDWPTPTGFKTINRFFEKEATSPSVEKDVQSKQEEANKSSGMAQKLDSKIDTFKHRFGMGFSSESKRSSYNDNDTYKDKYNIDIKNSTVKEETVRIPLSIYEPNNSEESRCLEIATALGEKDMSFILTVLKRSGLGVIERSYGLYKEQCTGGNGIQNPAAYFNSLVKAVEKEQKSD